MDLSKTYLNSNLENRRKQILQRQHADRVLRERKGRRGTVRDQIVAAFDGRDAGPVSQLLLRNLGTRKRPVKGAAREALRRLFLRVEGQSALLDEDGFARGVAQLARFYEQWVRGPEEWTPRSHNARRQFSSLARHLLARYDVPAFMDAAWVGDDVDFKLHQQWFVHVGRGENIRKAPGLPVALTKMMAHHVLLAPDDCTINRAVRWGQLRGTGVPERIARGVLGSRLGNEFFGAEQEQFWGSVFNFFALHPTIDPNQVGPVIDYLHNQKFVPAGPVNVGGAFVQQGPPQPGLSMKGRTPEGLVQQVDAWHRQLRRVRRGGGDVAWGSCLIPGYDRIEGEAPNQRRFFIVELLGSGELRAEGTAMHHCVGTYAWSCQSGKTAIYSFRADEGTGPYRRLTVEVDVRRREITEARGKYNAMPTEVDKRILNAWATTARLSLGRYAFGYR